MAIDLATVKGLPLYKNLPRISDRALICHDCLNQLRPVIVKQTDPVMLLIQTGLPVVL